MHARKLMLTVLGGGTALGLLFGASIDTRMKPPPEPPWRQTFHPPAPSSNESYRFVDAGPQDLSPTWYVDRTPTWKRHREDRLPDYAPLQYTEYTEYTELPAPEPALAPAPDDPDAAVADPAAEQRQMLAIEHAAAAEDAADDAKAAMALSPQPDAAEQEPATTGDEAAL
jgi:hypothetical protein